MNRKVIELDQPEATETNLSGTDFDQRRFDHSIRIALISPKGVATVADNYPEQIGRLHSELKRIGCMRGQAKSGDFTVYEICRSPQNGCDTRLKTYTQVLDGRIAPLLDALAKIPDKSGPAGLEQALDEAGAWYWLPQF